MEALRGQRTYFPIPSSRFFFAHPAIIFHLRLGWRREILLSAICTSSNGFCPRGHNLLTFWCQLLGQQKELYPSDLKARVRMLALVAVLGLLGLAAGADENTMARGAPCRMKHSFVPSRRRWGDQQWRSPPFNLSILDKQGRPVLFYQPRHEYTGAQHSSLFAFWIPPSPSQRGHSISLAD